MLRPEHKAYLRRFSEIRHLPLQEERLQSLSDPLRLAVGLPVGTHGMYFTGMIEGDPNHSYGLVQDALLEYSCALPRTDVLAVQENEPSLFPSRYCQWEPTRNGKGIEWSQGDKFYGDVEWLRFLLEHFLLPWGYDLTGAVSYQGEQGEHGKIIVENHQVMKVVESDSLIPRQPSESMDEEIHLYWMTVGALSAAARRALLEADCPVLDLCQQPPVVLVGLRYDVNYHKRHGHDDLAIWRTEGIALYSCQ